MSGIDKVAGPEMSSAAFWGMLCNSEPSAANSQSSSSGHSAAARLPSDSNAIMACKGDTARV